MSDNNNDVSSPAVLSSVAVESSGATKRSHNEMETKNIKTSTSNKETSINTKIDNDALFASGMEKIILAKKELALAQKRVELAQQHMEGIRQQIRVSGEYEPDSLLFLCDGEDNNILSLIMGYLAVEEVGRCEVVCSVLKKQAVQYWENLDELYFANHPTLRSPSADTSREAAIQYKAASTLAESIGNMGDSIISHLVVFESTGEWTSADRRIHGECLGCAFPNLNFQPFRRRTMDDYELFVRFCRTSDNKLLAEGFVPCSYEREGQYLGGDKVWTRLHLRNLDFSNWPQLAELAHLIETSDEDPFRNNNVLRDYMNELTVVVVCVHKGTSEASLSLAQCNFGHFCYTSYRNDGSGYCKPQGRMSVKSHGTVETRPIQYETFTGHKNKFCDASMELRWSSQVQTDHNSGETSTKECLWVLDCVCNYEDKDYDGEPYRREIR